MKVSLIVEPNYFNVCRFPTYFDESIKNGFDGLEVDSRACHEVCSEDVGDGQQTITRKDSQKNIKGMLKNV